MKILMLCIALATALNVNSQEENPVLHLQAPSKKIKWKKEEIWFRLILTNTAPSAIYLKKPIVAAPYNGDYIIQTTGIGYEVYRLSGQDTVNCTQMITAHMATYGKKGDTISVFSNASYDLDQDANVSTFHFSQKGKYIVRFVIPSVSFFPSINTHLYSNWVTVNKN